jgi:hypothetical protein
MIKTISPIRYTEPICTTIHSLTPKIIYESNFAPVVTSIRQIRSSSNQTLSRVNTSILNEEVIDSSDHLLKNEIQNLRNSVKNNEKSENEVNLYKQKIAVLKNEIF